MPRRRRYRNSRALDKVHKRITKVARSVQGELKFTDVTDTMEADSDYGEVSDLFQNIGTGTAGANDIIGNQLKCRSILLRGKVLWNSNAPTSTVRLVLFKETADDDTTPQMMSNTGTHDYTLLHYSATDAYKPLAPLKHENTARWKVLWSEILVGNPDSTDALVFERYIKLNHTVYFANDQSVKKGGLWFGVIGDQTTASTNAAEVLFWSRIKYIDN